MIQIKTIYNSNQRNVWGTTNISWKVISLSIRKKTEAILLGLLYAEEPCI